jgi:hypothetical protein
VFRNTKVGKSVEGLPIGDSYAGEVYLSLFDKFGPWESDSYQHILAEATAEGITEYIQNVYTKENPSALWSVTLKDLDYLQSDSKKYIIPFKDEFFHYVLNTLVVILYIKEKDPDAQFVIMTGNAETNGYWWKEADRNKSVEFLELILNINNISYLLLDPEYELHKYQIYPAKNVFVVNDFLTTRELSLAEITFAINKYVLDKLNVPVVPGKKIYISRGESVLAESAYEVTGIPESGYATNFVRIYGEPKLEEYLESQGFEIFRYNSVESLEDQVRLFASAELVMGATGTGLVNVLFMNDKQNVIELKTEIKWFHGDHEANSHYVWLSYGKGHRFMFLDVSDKQADTAIAELKRLRWFLID